MRTAADAMFEEATVRRMISSTEVFVSDVEGQIKWLY